MNIRPATKDDVQFLKKMLYEAARWNPDWPREPIEEVLADPVLVRYHQGWGREGDGGVVAEVDAVPGRGGVVPAVHGRRPRLRLRGRQDPGAFDRGRSACTGGRGSARRCSDHAWCRPARRGSRRCRSRSPCTTGRG